MAEQAGGSIAAKRYAEAVFGIARDTDTQDQWRDDLDSLAILASSPDAQRYLESARTPDADKRRLIEAVLPAEGDAQNLALLLLQRGRLVLAPEIAAEYGRMLDAARGIEHARVTTAVPLGAVDQAAIAERLRELTGANEVRLETDVDPSIIGGMVARIGDRLIDGSTRTRLIELRQRLEGAVR